MMINTRTMKTETPSCPALSIIRTVNLSKMSMGITLLVERTSLRTRKVNRLFKRNAERRMS
jgi:hypothetical protein